MIIPYENPDDFVVEVKEHRCEHHKRQPWDRNWAGCTCSSSYGKRRATPEEKVENIRRRQEEEARRIKHMRDYDNGLIK